MQIALLDSLKARPRRWLLTGSAGFIGSNLLEALLRTGQTVVSLDNFATGHRRNLDQVRDAVGDDAWAKHRFVEGDIADAVLRARFHENLRAFLSLAEAAKHYPCIKRAWVEFLGETPGTAVDRVDPVPA